MTARDPRRWPALFVLLTGAFLPILDFNVVNLALPAIRDDLHASSSQVQFVISAYAATYAVFLITGGRLGDWLGRKRMFLGGVAGFTLASLVCGTARSADGLIAARVLQAITATAMAPQVLASIRELFSTEDQPLAFGLYGATFGLANIVGQVLGGVLVSLHPFGVGWPAVFLVNVPVGLAAFTGGIFFLKTVAADHAQRLDLGGVALLSLTLGTLVYPLVEGREQHWPAWIVAMATLSPLTLAGFVLFERRVARRGGSPLVDLSLFGAPGFATGIVMAVVFYMLSAFYLTFSIYLQAGLRLSPLAAGLRTLPLGAGYFLSSFASAWLMKRLGPYALTLGFTVQVLGFSGVLAIVWGHLPADVAPGLDLSLGLAGAGYGIVMPSLIKAVIGGVDPRHAGLASGIVMSTLQIGSALGVAIIGGIFYSVLDARSGDYPTAFAAALGCNIVLLILGGALSLRLSNTAKRAQ